MTEIKNAPADSGNEPITVETAKVIQGISLVFCGALTMLEALHPHVSLAPSAILDLVTGNVEGLEKAAAERRAEAEKEINRDTGNAENAEGTEGTAVTADAVPDASDAPVDTAPDERVTESREAARQHDAPTATLTVDDITKVIVQKIKQNRSNNEKIGQFLKVHGVSKVSELPASKFEAFLTDLSAI